MSRPSVLIVDDDPGTVETLTDIFQAKSYRVATAYSGEEAIAEARRARYDAVVMDIVMPGLNGVEALKAIKASAPQTNVIMITAFTRHELVEEAKRGSALAVLPKPLDVDRLLALLESAARGRPHGEPR